MGFREAIVHVFRNYANFSGRARRREFWYFMLCYSLLTTVLRRVSAAYRVSYLSLTLTLLTLLINLGTMLPRLALTWRRLHDTGRSGAWYFLAAAPVFGAYIVAELPRVPNYFATLLLAVGMILLFWFFCKDSQPGENQYGPNPKGNNRAIGRSRVCNVCGWIYDEAETGIKWEDLPEDFVCGSCGAGAHAFRRE